MKYFQTQRSSMSSLMSWRALNLHTVIDFSDRNLDLLKNSFFICNNKISSS